MEGQWFLMIFSQHWLSLPSLPSSMKLVGTILGKVHCIREITAGG